METKFIPGKFSKQKFNRILYFSSTSRTKWFHTFFSGKSLAPVNGSPQWHLPWGPGHIGAIGKQETLFQSDYKARSESEYLFWPAWGFPMTTK